MGEAGLDIQAQAAINTHEAIARHVAIAHSAGTGVCDDPPTSELPIDEVGNVQKS